MVCVSITIVFDWNESKRKRKMQKREREKRKFAILPSEMLQKNDVENEKIEANRNENNVEIETSENVVFFLSLCSLFLCVCLNIHTGIARRWKVSRKKSFSAS